jgi:hypothetical protein
MEMGVCDIKMGIGPATLEINLGEGVETDDLATGKGVDQGGDGNGGV